MKTVSTSFVRPTQKVAVQGSGRCLVAPVIEPVLFYVFRAKRSDEWTLSTQCYPAFVVLEDPHPSGPRGCVAFLRMSQRFVLSHEAAPDGGQWKSYARCTDSNHRALTSQHS